MLNWRAVGPGSNLVGAAGKDFFYSLLFSYVLHGPLCRRSSHLKTPTFSIVKITTDLKWLILFIVTIEVYCIRVLVECVNAIYLVLYLTHTLLVVQVRLCYSYVFFIM